MFDPLGMRARMNALTPTRFGQHPSPACLPCGTVERVTDAVAAAEEAILSAMNSERAALRAGRLMAADALHLRLRAAAHAYTDALRGARAVFDLVARNQPEVRQR